jgi:hypothetical protein
MASFFRRRSFCRGLLDPFFSSLRRWARFNSDFLDDLDFLLLVPPCGAPEGGPGFDNVQLTG